MTDVLHPPVDEGALIGTSKLVTTVFDQILAAVHEGTLLPGQRISDAELAAELGVSRTPVREALQRLREIGIIEASASRFTRIAVVTPAQTAQAYVVWLALYGPLVEEVVPHASRVALAAMQEDHARFHESLEARDAQELARTNFDFFSRLPAESVNAALQRALTSVVHIVRLGSLHLPEYVDLQAIERAQRLLLTAVERQDVAVARDAMLVLGDIRIPIE